MISRKICILLVFLVSQALVFLFHVNDGIIRGLQQYQRAMTRMMAPNVDNKKTSASSSSFPHYNHTFTKQKQQQQQDVLIHLHIGKNGGTSLDGLLSRISKLLQKKYIGYRHFDWSYIEQLQQSNDNIKVFTMFSSPIQRAKSHYESAKIWMSPLKYHKNITLTQYLQNTQLLLNTRSIWRDGQAGVSWLTGSHTEEWVVGNLNTSELQRRQDMYQNQTALCLLAAERLDQTTWFGLLGVDVDRSMQLLQYTLQLNTTPILPRGNVNPYGKSKTSIWEKQVLESLMPMDIWLYKYATLLFNARYQQMMTGVFVPPPRPPVPSTWSCRFNTTCLDCIDGPLKGMYPIQSTTARGVLIPNKQSIAANDEVAA